MLGDQMEQILLVEDCNDLRPLFARALRMEGFHVHSAANGADALAVLQSGYRPDLVLLDMCMPGMGGATFLKRLKEMPGSSGIKTVVVSGLDDLPRQAQEMGADGFIKKPIDLTRFYEEVRKHLLASPQIPDPTPRL